MDTAEYRARALDLRDKAKITHDQEVRAHLLMMADEYDWLAARLEDQERETGEPERSKRAS